MPTPPLVKKPLQATVAKLKRTGRALGKLKPQPVHPVQALQDIKARRVARRSSSGLQLVLADRVDFLNPAHWDALAAQTVFLSRDYLRVLEAHAPDNLEPRYAMAYADGRPVGIQPVKVSTNGLFDVEPYIVLDLGAEVSTTTR